MNEENTSAVNRSLPVGTIIDGKYEILGFLGKGGMASVYEALHTELAQHVALKVVDQEAKDPKQAQRFQREARLLSSLSHPNLIAIKAFGTTNDGTSYLVMDLVSGQSLANLLKDSGPLLPERAIPIFSQICDALACAHKEGIVHRDLKPSNVVVQENDRIKLLDFGIAKLVDREEDEEQSRKPVEQSLTISGTPIGSPDYMSPEQCTTQAIDARSDIYSLGCLMYETIDGAPPFRSDSAYLCMSRHVNDRPPESERLARYPDLRNVIFRCLEKKPEMRFPTADTLKKELLAQATTAKLKPMISAAGSNRWRLFILPVMAILLLAATGLFMFQQRQAALKDPTFAPPPELIFGDRRYTLAPQIHWTKVRDSIRNPADQAIYTKAWVDYHRNRHQSPEDILMAYFLLIVYHQDHPGDITREEYGKMMLDAQEYVNRVHPEPVGAADRFRLHLAKARIFHFLAVGKGFHDQHNEEEELKLATQCLAELKDGMSKHGGVLYSELSHLYIDSCNHEKAIESLSKAIEYTRKDEHGVRAQLYLALYRECLLAKKAKGAQAALAKTIEERKAFAPSRDGSYVVSMLNLSLMLTSAGDTKNGALVCRDALKAATNIGHPENLSAFIEMQTVNSRDLKVADNLAWEYFRLFPAKTNQALSIRFAMRMAELLYNAGADSLAQKYVNAIEDDKEEGYDAKLALTYLSGNNFLRYGNAEKALALFDGPVKRLEEIQKISEKLPADLAKQDVMVSCMIGKLRAHCLEKRFDQAEQDLQEILALRNLRTDELKSKQNRAFLFLVAALVPDKPAEATRVLTKYGQSTFARNEELDLMIGLIFCRQGNYAAGLATLEAIKANLKRSELFEPQYYNRCLLEAGIGSCLVGLGKPIEARAHLKAGLKLADEHLAGERVLLKELLAKLLDTYKDADAGSPEADTYKRRLESLSEGRATAII